MEIRIEKIQDISILKMTGKLDSSSSPGFMDDIFPEIEKQSVKMVISLKEVDYISSAGIRVLLIICRKLNESAGKLVLTEVNPNVMGVLKMAGIPSIIPILNEIDEILKFMA